MTTEDDPIQSQAQDSPSTLRTVETEKSYRYLFLRYHKSRRKPRSVRVINLGVLSPSLTNYNGLKGVISTET